MTRLALFDLDHTLIPFDSGMAWTQHLVAAGRLPPDAESQYLDYCHQYVAGTLDIRAMHRASVAPLATVPVAQIEAWAHEFEAQVASRIPAARRALVRQHQQAGDLCAIVTATTRFVAAPFARLFGVADLLATQPEVRRGRYSGDIVGEPCFREHKRAHVQAWLAPSGRSLDSFEQSFFYSDSASDLPLLEAVSHPVAVCPDARLHARAQALGWPILEP